MVLCRAEVYRNICTLYETSHTLWISKLKIFPNTKSTKQCCSFLNIIRYFCCKHRRHSVLLGSFRLQFHLFSNVPWRHIPRRQLGTRPSITSKHAVREDYRKKKEILHKDWMFIQLSYSKLVNLSSIVFYLHSVMDSKLITNRRNRCFINLT